MKHRRCFSLVFLLFFMGFFRNRAYAFSYVSAGVPYYNLQFLNARSEPSIFPAWGLALDYAWFLQDNFSVFLQYEQGIQNSKNLFNGFNIGANWYLFGGKPTEIENINFSYFDEKEIGLVLIFGVSQKLFSFSTLSVEGPGDMLFANQSFILPFIGLGLNFAIQNGLVLGIRGTYSRPLFMPTSDANFVLNAGYLTLSYEL